MVKRSREDSPPFDTTDSPSPSSTAEPSSPSAIAAVDASRTTKYLQIPHEVAEDRSRAVMRCSLAPHSETLSFGTFEEFEVHYAQVHTNRCSECHKNFPTQHFLGLHISEKHDPLVEARKAREEKTVRTEPAFHTPDLALAGSLLTVTTLIMSSIVASSRIAIKCARRRRSERCICRRNTSSPRTTISSS